LSLGAVISFVPWRAIDKYHNYRGMNPGMRTMLEEQDFDNALLLINGEAHPDLNSALVYTALDPYGDKPVIAWNRDPEVRQRLLEAYPDKNVWLVEGPSRTGDGYRISAGPLKASELMH